MKYDWYSIVLLLNLSISFRIHFHNVIYCIWKSLHILTIFMIDCNEFVDFLANLNECIFSTRSPTPPSGCTRGTKAHMQNMTYRIDKEIIAPSLELISRNARDYGSLPICLWYQLSSSKVANPLLTTCTLCFKSCTCSICLCAVILDIIALFRPQT